jgi:deferrochelatase/peroxidase EfeB
VGWLPVGHRRVGVRAIRVPRQHHHADGPRFWGNGVLADDNSWRRVEPGELLIGHRDESGAISGHADARQLERNGSYLVIRRIRQYLDGFWAESDGLQGLFPPTNNQPTEQATPAGPPPPYEIDVWQQRVMWGNAPAAQAAEQLVGRRRNGTVLQTGTGAIGDGFQYGQAGVAVSPAAHIRRANPRDAIGKAARLTPRHVLFRRSVPFWEPHPSENCVQPAGLMFMAFCADIQRQFEFVNARWLQDGSRFGLGSERDGLTGTRPADGEPVSVNVNGERRRTPMGQFVEHEQGVYLLVPSRQALQLLINGVPPPQDAT